MATIRHISAWATAWAWEQDVPATQKLVLLALAGHVGSDGLAWPSLSRLEALCGCARSTVCTALSALEKSGHVIRSRRTTGTDTATSTLYQLNTALVRNQDYPSPESGLPSPATGLPPSPATGLPLVRQPDPNRAIRKEQDLEHTHTAATPVVHDTPSAPTQPLVRQRDHRAHSYCGAPVCVPGFLDTEFRAASGKPEAEGIAYVTAFYASESATWRAAPGDPIGDAVTWWRDRWRLKHPMARPATRQEPARPALPSFREIREQRGY